MCPKPSASTPSVALQCALLLIFVLLPLVHGSLAQAETVLKFDPFISVEEMYDDNIFLSRSYKRSDWITTASPGFFTSVANPRYSADLRYSPGFVYFLHNPEYDYTSHELTFNGRAELTSRLTASLYEFFIRSNDPDLEEMVDTDYERSLRRDTREKFNRNIISPQLEYGYGRENSIRLNYRNTKYNSEDPEESDYLENYVEGQVDHWFSVRDGISVLTHFSKGNFDDEADLLHSIDITPRYRHRFSPHFELYGEYGWGTADFEETRLYRTLENGRELQIGVEDNEDYDLQKFNIGFEWQLPANLRLLGSMGYFWRDGEEDSDEEGITSLVTIEKSIRNFRFNLGWESGYSANYFAVRDEGFTKFWEVTAGGTYIYHQNLELSLRGGYGYEEYASERGRTALEDEREDYSYQALFQITYHILRNWGLLSDLAVEFTFNHRELDSDLDTDYYISNKSIGKITATF
jgi:hypothetical protein